MALDLVMRSLSSSSVEKNKRINAIVTWNPEAEKQAREAISSGLDVFPITIKDNIMTKGIRTTAGSRIFYDFVPTVDAEVVTRIKRSGGIIIGKDNLHELGSGVTTTSSVFGPTRNPHDLSRIAGGSSGGSAAAVAAGIVPVALAGDVGGSIRIPASLCGVYGFKPSYGAVPSSGAYSLAPSLGSRGIIASSIEWVERIFKIVARPDILRRKVRDIDPDKAVLGIPVGLFKASKDVEKGFYDFISRFKYKEVSLELALKHLRQTFSVIRYSEATRTFLNVRDRWGELHQDVRRLLERGLEYKATEYIEALNMKKMITREFDKILREVDFLVTPTTPIPAPRIEDVLGKEDGEIRTILTSNTIYANVTGAPAISIPMLKSEGLPVGIQIIGRRFADIELLRFVARIVSS